MLTQAAGPGDFLSKLWKRDAVPKKITYGALNPFNWLHRETSTMASGRVRISDGGQHVTSERPELVRDPFLATGSSNQTAPMITRRQLVARNEQVNDSDVAETLATGTPMERSGNVAESQRVNSVPVAQPPHGGSSIPDSASPRSASGSQFVGDFDGNFQRLVQSVVAESRIEKSASAAPQLPDGIELGSRAGRESSDVSLSLTPSAQPSQSVSESSAVEERPEFPDFSSQQSRQAVSELIQQSRRELDSSVLASRTAVEDASRRAAGIQRLPDRLEPGRPVTDQGSVSAASHVHSARTLAENNSRLEAGVTPTRLSNQRGEILNSHVVPSELLPRRSFYTTSENWLNRNAIPGGNASVEGISGDSQSDIRVVPGSAGGGVVIESGQSSPIRPRVISNGAPIRAVPDTSQFRRLSFEGSKGERQGGAVQAIAQDRQYQQPGERSAVERPSISPSPPSNSFLPSMRLPGGESANDALMFPETDGSLSNARNESDHDVAQVAALNDAPSPPKLSPARIDWPNDSEIAPTTSSGSFSWGTAAICLILFSTVSGLFLRRRRQAGTVGIIGTSGDSENS